MNRVGPLNSMTRHKHDVAIDYLNSLVMDLCAKEFGLGTIRPISTTRLTHWYELRGEVTRCSGDERIPPLKERNPIHMTAVLFFDALIVDLLEHPTSKEVLTPMRLQAARKHIEDFKRCMDEQKVWY